MARLEDITVGSHLTGIDGYSGESRRFERGGTATVGFVFYRDVGSIRRKKCRKWNEIF